MAGKTITTRYLAPVVTVPAGTAIATPHAVAVPLGGDLTTWDELQIAIPDGHAGLTGIRVAYDGTPILPWNDASQWIVGNGETPTFQVGFDASHPVTVVTYNLDIFPHSFYLRFKVSDILGPVSTPGATVVPITPRMVG